MASLTELPIIRVRNGMVTDCSFVDDLRRKNSEAVGFIPRDGLQEIASHGRLSVALRQDQLCGFVIRGQDVRGKNGHTNIYMLAVAEQSQRIEIGTALVQHVAHQCRWSPAIRLRCRDGLPANEFWKYLGFELEAVELGGSERRKMVNRWNIQPGNYLNRCNISCTPQLNCSASVQTEAKQGSQLVRSSP